MWIKNRKTEQFSDVFSTVQCKVHTLHTAGKVYPISLINFLSLDQECHSVVTLLVTIWLPLKQDNVLLNDKEF